MIRVECTRTKLILGLSLICLLSQPRGTRHYNKKGIMLWLVICGEKERNEKKMLGGEEKEKRNSVIFFFVTQN